MCECLKPTATYGEAPLSKEQTFSDALDDWYAENHISTKSFVTIVKLMLVGVALTALVFAAISVYQRQPAMHHYNDVFYW